MPTFIRYIPTSDRTIRPREQRAIGENTVPDPVRFVSKLPGDPIALRGIPAIGRGVGGAIEGTRPDQIAS